MTSLLVLGLIALMFGMVRTAKRLSDKQQSSAAAPGIVGEKHVRLPKDSRLLSTNADQGRLFLTIEGADGEIILIVDPNTGQEIGRLYLDRDGDE